MCALGTDFKQLGLDDLKRIAYRSARLQHNWSRELIRPVWSTTLTLPEAWSQKEIVAAISGTPRIILLATTPDGDVLALCLVDDEPEQRIIHATMGSVIHHASYDDKGKCLIGLIFQRRVGPPNQRDICIFSITHGHGQNLNIHWQKIYQSTIVDHFVYTDSAFILENVFGYRYIKGDGKAYIRAINYVKNTHIDFHEHNADFSRGVSVLRHSKCFKSDVSATHLVTVCHSGDSDARNTYRFPIGTLFDSVANGMIYNSPQIEQVDATHFISEPTMMGCPPGHRADVHVYHEYPSPLGLHLVTAGWYCVPGGVEELFDSFTVVQFSPYKNSVGADMTDEVRIARVELPCFYRNIDFSASGTYALLAGEGDNVSDFLLLEFRLDPPRIETRQVALPFILSTLCTVIDERSGVIYFDNVISGARCTLQAVRFA
ncbi:hypothetical protein D9615_000844 [Tricholomella constricta]|uniref:Uncharacterized protein n=1 Tax=Tricholomella constricta TaxID=117010 RepID=A0A8H5HRZ2_9AGAR|nr:hypothetical protein D9615_000844 [Tricholomella constricta]